MIFTDDIQRLKELIVLCNQYRDAYYNHQPIVPDDVYDRYFDELTELEKKTGCYFADSPAQSVGYQVVDSCSKVHHDIPLLSLAKTKQISDVIKFADNKEVLFMIKGDGLTTKLVYKSDGETASLIEASTRGNGVDGSLITHNAKTFNIPLKVNYPCDFTVTGESVILQNDFDKINAALPEEEKYANCRNLASGSLSLLDANECAKRHIHFLSFDVISGMDDIPTLGGRLEKLSALGFEVIYYLRVHDITEKLTERYINTIHKYADNHGIPCDGAVIRFNDYAYGTSLGRTAHHYNYGIAKKEEDDFVETTFRGIEWNTSRNGIVVPTGMFDTVEVTGSQVSRATLHNLDYIDGLKLRIGNRICVSKRNMVIPAIEVNLDYDPTDYQLPLIDRCPSCGAKLEVIHPNNTNLLYCANEMCPSRQIGRLVHFVSKPCMNIDGLSEATLQKLMDMGFVKNFEDIYQLKDNPRLDLLQNTEGFGEKSVNNLLTAIENSRNTTLDRFVNALGIPTIGANSSKIIAKHCKYDWLFFEDALMTGFNFSALPDFGNITNDNLYKWSTFYLCEAMTLAKHMRFSTVSDTVATDSLISGKRFCITGSFAESRDVLKEKLEKLGGIWVGSVSKKLDILFCGDKAGSKMDKAKECGVKVLFEKNLMEILDNA